MPVKTKELKHPTGFARLLWRMPIGFYKLGLGGLLGERFILLTHTGRKSGIPRQTVLEVVRYDKETGKVIIASGFGASSDWYQNILKNPDVTFQLKNKRCKAIARQLSSDEAGAELLNYSQRHPLAMRELATFMGYSVDGSDADVLALGRMIPIFSLTPVE